MAWQQASGYTKSARAEAAIGRWKQVIGDRLRAHTDERRATEVDVVVYVLNRMLELGRPNYVRTAPARPSGSTHGRLRKVCGSTVFTYSRISARRPGASAVWLTLARAVSRSHGFTAFRALSQGLVAASGEYVFGQLENSRRAQVRGCSLDFAARGQLLGPARG